MHEACELRSHTPYMYPIPTQFPIAWSVRSIEELRSSVVHRDVGLTVESDSILVPIFDTKKDKGAVPGVGGDGEVKNETDATPRRYDCMDCIERGSTRYVHTRCSSTLRMEVGAPSCTHARDERTTARLAGLLADRPRCRHTCMGYRQYTSKIPA